MDYTCRIWK